MPINHGVAAGMSGIRTSGDLVARVQMAKGLRIDAAKQYVADKLKISLSDLHDSSVMRDIRNQLNIGETNARPESADALAAKSRIAQILDIEINSVTRFNKMSKI
jgi:dimethylamine--corrinoid protein Co-methyltransferase